MSILIVGYNSGAVIRACLDAIPAACSAYRYEVLLVDNGDGTTAGLVSQEYPTVRIIPSKGNVGFAAGNNMLAAEATAPFLLLANPDLEMRPSAVDELMKASQRYPAAAAWGGVTLGRDGRPDIGNTVHVPSLREMASRVVGRSLSRIKKHQTFEQDQRAEALSGGFVMFSHAAWTSVGGMDARYFLYCEEVDLFVRLKKQGFEFWRIAKARAFHDIGHGEPASALRQLYLYAGIMQFARIHWGQVRQNLAFLLIWIGSLTRFVLGSVLGIFNAKGKETANKQRLLLLKPNYWRHGYHPRKGLQARIQKSPI